MRVWNLFETAGGLLVLSGVLGQVWADVSRPEREGAGETSSMVLLIGVALSLLAIVGSDEHISRLVATMVMAVLRIA